MKNILTVCFLFICLNLSSREIAFVGDSISSKNNSMILYEHTYVSLIEKHFKDVGSLTKIINISVGGTNTWGAIDQLDYLFQYHNPSVVILEFGFNDIGRGMSIDVTQQNFSKMIDICKKKGCFVILCKIDISCLYPYASEEYINRFHAIFHIQEENVLVFDFLNAEMLTSPIYNLGDKIHPNINGHRRIYEALIKHLQIFL